MHRHLSSCVIDPQIKCVSPDLDTTVLKWSGSDRAFYLLLARQLLDKGMINTNPESFARLRQTCELRARKNSQAGEIQLIDIYNELLFSHELNYTPEVLMQEELSAEAQYLYVIPGVYQSLDWLRNRFGRVIFISDSYLPYDFVKNKLTDLGVFKPSDRLYLSSSYGLKKDDGLFNRLLKNEKLYPSELLHIGGSLPTSVNTLKALGIPAYYYPAQPDIPAEEVLNAYAYQTEAFSSQMAGAAKRTRLQGSLLEGDTKAIWNTAASVTGPFCLLYALWIVERALQKGIQNLYFLARDAYLPYLAVRSVIDVHPEAQAKLNCSYIYGSRVTYKALDIEKLSLVEWEKLTTHGNLKYSTLNELQAALFCQKSTFAGHLKALKFEDKDWNRVLNTDELESIKDFALTNSQFNEAILHDIRAFQETTMEYFRKQGFNPDQGVALIDSGWTTNSHAPLYHFLKQAGCRNLRIFYIGLMSTEPPVSLDVVDTFIFNRASKQGIKRPDIYYARPVESLLMTNHGRTFSFTKKEDRIVPVLDNIENKDYVERFYETYQAGFLEFLKHIVPHLPKTSAIHDHRGLSEQIIARFWNEPTEDEVRVWSTLDWEWDPMGTKKFPLARAYKVTDSWLAFLQGRSPDCYAQFWRAGAEKLTFKPTMMVINLASFCNRLGRKVIAAFLELMSKVRPEAKEKPLLKSVKTGWGKNSFKNATTDVSIDQEFLNLRK